MRTTLLLLRTVAATNVIISYQLHCNDTRTDAQIVKDIWEVTEGSSDDPPTAGPFLTSSTHSRRQLTDSDIELTLALYKNYYREDRIITANSKRPIPRVQRRQLRSTTSWSPSSTPDRRLLKDTTSLEERRDRILAILSVAASPTSHVAALDESSEQNEQTRLETDFLPILGMDVLYEPSNKMKTVAQYLPCLEVPPEVDSEKEIVSNIPNDLQQSDLEQWGLMGRTPNSNPVGSDAVTAWNTYTGMGRHEDDRFIVAVVDTGCSMHPDLESNLCLSNDSSCAGYDFGDDDPNPFDEPLHKVHGTSVTSIIAGRSNNGYGISGICWGCKIMCLKVHNSASNSITLSSLLRAYEHILKYNVKLSNHSYISFGYSKTEYKALSVMRDRGHLLVVAAGNYGCDLDEVHSDGSAGCKIDGKNAGLASPASYPLDNILTVGSVDRNGSLSYFSGWGATSVDIMAPGSSIPVILNSLKYKNSIVGTVAGTSFAVPHVTGGVALVWGRNPNLSYIAVRNILLEKGYPVESLKGKSTTGKVLDIGNAVSAVANGKIDKGWRESVPVTDHTADYYDSTQPVSNNGLKAAAVVPTTIAIILMASCFYP